MQQSNCGSNQIVEETGIREIIDLKLLIESVGITAEYATGIVEIVLNLNIESTLG